MRTETDEPVTASCATGICRRRWPEGRRGPSALACSTGGSAARSAEDDGSGSTGSGGRTARDAGLRVLLPPRPAEAEQRARATLGSATSSRESPAQPRSLPGCLLGAAAGGRSRRRSCSTADDGPARPAPSRAGRSPSHSALRAAGTAGARSCRDRRRPVARRLVGGCALVRAAAARRRAGRAAARPPAGDRARPRASSRPPQSRSTTLPVLPAQRSARSQALAPVSARPHRSRGRCSCACTKSRAATPSTRSSWRGRSTRTAAVAEPGAPLPMPESLEPLVGDRHPRARRSRRGGAARRSPRSAGNCARSARTAGSPSRTLAPAVAAQVSSSPAWSFASLIRCSRRRSYRACACRGAAPRAPPPGRRRGRSRRAVRVTWRCVRRGAGRRRRRNARGRPRNVARARGAPSVGRGARRGRGARHPARRASRRAAAHDARAARDHLAAGGVERAFALGARAPRGKRPGRRPRRGARAPRRFRGAGRRPVPGRVALPRGAPRERATPPRARALAHQRAGVMRSARHAGASTRPEEHAREALRLAEELSDDGLRAEALATLAIVRFALGEPDSLRARAACHRPRVRLSTDDDARLVARDAASVTSWPGRAGSTRRGACYRGTSRAVAERDERDGCGGALVPLARRDPSRPARRSRASTPSTLASDQPPVLPPELADDPDMPWPVAPRRAHQGDDGARARSSPSAASRYAERAGGMSTGRFSVALLGMLDQLERERRCAPSSASTPYARAAARGRRARTPTAIHIADHVEALLALGRLADASACSTSGTRRRASSGTSGPARRSFAAAGSSPPPAATSRGARAARGGGVAPRVGRRPVRPGAGAPRARARPAGARGRSAPRVRRSRRRSPASRRSAPPAGRRRRAPSSAASAAAPGPRG